MYTKLCSSIVITLLDNEYVYFEYVLIWQLDLFLFKYVAAYYARYEEKLALMSEKYQKYFFLYLKWLENYN